MCHQWSLWGSAKTPKFSKHSRASSAQWHYFCRHLKPASAVADTASSLLMWTDCPHNHSLLLPASTTSYKSIFQCATAMSPSCWATEKSTGSRHKTFCVVLHFLSVSVQCGVLLSTTVPWEGSIHMKQKLMTWIWKWHELLQAHTEVTRSINNPHFLRGAAIWGRQEGSRGQHNSTASVGSKSQSPTSSSLL